MLTFKEFCFKDDLLKEFDECIKNTPRLNEADYSDLGLASIITKNLDSITIPNIRSVLGIISVIFKYIGKKGKDIMQLFSPEGLDKIKAFIKDDILGSKELRYIIKTFDPDKYKGYKGFEQYISDMKQDQPELFDSLVKGIKNIIL